MQSAAVETRRAFADGQVLTRQEIATRIELEMPEANPRDRMIEALRELPKNATVDDAIERLVFLARIEVGLAEIDRGEGLPHDEVRRRLGVRAGWAPEFLQQLRHVDRGTGVAVGELLTAVTQARRSKGPIDR